MQWLLEPYQFEFFRTGSLVALLAGVMCGMLGVYIVLRGMSYIGHGLSHAIFGGAVVSLRDAVELLHRRGAVGLLLRGADQPDGAAHAHRILRTASS
jgi:ABC-type Mn2+/Zn2+ transport system permease subunit